VELALEEQRGELQVPALIVPACNCSQQPRLLFTAVSLRLLLPLLLPLLLEL
jgi:hypothetical protein